MGVSEAQDDAEDDADWGSPVEKDGFWDYISLQIGTWRHSAAATWRLNLRHFFVGVREKGEQETGSEEHQKAETATSSKTFCSVQFSVLEM